ncbi:MAG: Flp pilus assembly protein TadG [Halocynthiibacter sp.]|jgi:Flp pilus assembly protein TadG
MDQKISFDNKVTYAELPRAAMARAKLHAKRFGKDEAGSLIVFSLFIFVLILLAGGMAVDIMRFESDRTRVQNTTDRAILAAADLDQTVDAQTVVNDYFAKGGLAGYTPLVTDDTDDLTYSTVTATTNVAFQSMFMKHLGIDTLPLSAAGKAQERISEIEISLVLDISGSMDGSNRLTNMKIAAKDFVKTIYDSAETDTVTMSIIPYNTQVNAGPEILSQFSRNFSHNYSHCLDFSSADFNETALDLTATYKQTLHFDPISEYGSWWGGVTGVTPEWWPCEGTSASTILPFSADRNILNAKIESLIADGNTSIDLGIKWGAAMLDPAFQPVTSALSVGTGATVNGLFSDRPVSYSDNSTMKVIVVMTDGENTKQYYMDDAYSAGGSDVFVNPLNTSQISVFRKSSGCINGTTTNCYWRKSTSSNSSGSMNTSPYGGASAVEYDYRDVFNRYTTNYVAQMYRWANNGSDSTYNFWDSAFYDYVDPSLKNTRMANICDAAKEKDIIIFTIGFEVDDGDAVYMENCASSESHFFRVAGTNLTTAFNEIANKISELRLVQ